MGLGNGVVLKKLLGGRRGGFSPSREPDCAEKNICWGLCVAGKAEF